MRSWAQDEHDVRGVGPLLSLGPRESSGLEAELETVPAALAALLTTFSALSAFAESTLPGAGHRTPFPGWGTRSGCSREPRDLGLGIFASPPPTPASVPHPVHDTAPWLFTTGRLRSLLLATVAPRLGRRGELLGSALQVRGPRRFDVLPSEKFLGKPVSLQSYQHFSPWRSISVPDFERSPVPRSRRRGRAAHSRVCSCWRFGRQPATGGSNETLAALDLRSSWPVR
jgi:hypothetical protein